MTKGTRIGWLVSEVSLVAIASERGMPLTRPISWLRNGRLNPRLLRYVLSSFVRSLKASSEEQIRRSLRAKLNTISVKEHGPLHPQGPSTRHFFIRRGT